MGQRRLSLAALDEAGQPAPAVRGHHDQIALLLIRRALAMEDFLYR